MTYSIKIIGILLLITLFSSCLKDGEDLCHSVGTVKIDLFVEKFRNQSDNPLDDREDSSLGRVNHLRYFIYKEGLLYEQGIIDKFTKTSGPLYSFLLSGLDYGNYNIVFVANCTKKSLRGDSTNIENLLLTFPGCEDTEDFFSAIFPFSVDSDNMMEYEVGLKRTHGIVRCTFNNLPNNISDIEIIMKNVNMEYWIAGDYKVAGEASRKYSLTELKDETVNGDYIIGTFPTPINEKSIYYLNIYKEDEVTPYISQMITDDFEIRRNQLLDISVTFNDGYLSFEIDMDSDWDGPSSGGEVGIE